MATTSDAPPDPLQDPELLETEWDLEPLVDGQGEAGVGRQLAAAGEQARAFATAYAGRLGELDSKALEQAMHELEAIQQLVGRAGAFAMLRFSTDTADPARGALLQRMQELVTEIETKLLFFELEWAALPDARAAELLGGEAELGFCSHH